MRHGVVVEAGTGSPLPGIAVSDGLYVVETDDEGRWALHVRDDAEYVFVTVPATHEALRSFFVDVRGYPPSPLRIELAARPGGAAAGFRFVQVTDLHVSVDGGRALREFHESGIVAPPGVVVTGAVTESQLAADLAEVVRRERPDFVTATGDLADFGRAEELAAYRRVMSDLGVPVATVPGNHDYLSCLNAEEIDRFAHWWLEEGMHEADGDPQKAFEQRVFGGDHRRPGSGRRPWVDEVGPPYYSFDWGEVHVVVYDSEGLLRYGDDYPQDRWLEADLDRVPRGSAVLVLLHFVEPESFFERFAGFDLLGSFAGHMHGDRVHRAAGSLHCSTPNLGFGAIDHSPPSYRVVEVDGRDLHADLVPLDPRLGNAADAALGPLTVGSHGVGVAVGHPDGRSTISVRDPGTGAPLWEHELNTPVKHQPAWAGENLLALTVTGQVVAFSGNAGEIRWEAQVGDPWRRWCRGGVAVQGHWLVAGGAACIGAFHTGTGAPRWVRDDLVHDDAMTSIGTPVISGDVVVAGFGSRLVPLIALDLATGATRWQARAVALLAVTCSTPIVCGDLVLMTVVPGWLRALDLETGAERWSAPLDGAWPVATPAVAGDLVVAVGINGTLAAFELATGAPAWSVELGPAPWSRRPYAREPSGHLAGPIVAGDVVYAAAASGRVIAVEIGTGDIVWEDDAGGPVCTAPALHDGNLLVLRADGTLRRFTPG